MNTCLFRWHAAAIFPRPWLMLCGNEPAMLEAGTQYLQVVGPLYGFFGLGQVLHFALQGAWRLFWPVIGNLARLVVASLGGWLALRWGMAFVVYGLVITATIAGGA
ncbi:MATE family efflux transporter [Pseudomonas sp. BN417]|uniref:MATE family efflux transporter n=1 Tax=Pseudomonas sp. BN417 TaxID=2567890 RepID=UPI002457B5A8|nr:MATE family efflux transporter [Pseudomonas sp. BN417]